MYSYKTFLLYLLFTVSFGLSESGYNTIYLMEFDNLKNDFTNTHLKEALPNLIKENYKFREDIKIEYAGSIKPYLKGYNILDEDSTKALIINGSFQTINEKFYIEYEAYDFHNWQRLVKRKFYCPTNDVICVHDAFLISVESSISPFLLDDIDVAETIQLLKKENKKLYEYDLDEKNNLESDTDLQPFDLTENLDNKYEDQGKYGNRYYREFEMQTILPSELPKVTKDVKDLEQVLDEILTDPYNVVIGDLYLDIDPYNSKNVIGEFSVQYSIGNLLSNKALNNIPHEKNILNNNDIIFRFSNRNFTFDDMLLEKIALMKFQVMPFISFNNRIGKALFIILDSWDDKYKILQFQKASILIEDQFKPLFSITSKSDIVQLTLNTSTLEVLYRFSLPYEVLGDYTKVTVKFIKESELEKLLEFSFRGD